MIEIVELGKSYDHRAILAGALLTVGAGESIALIGANGCGKTTTLRCAIGLARPDRGRILIDGVDVAARPCEARARMSYLAQRTDFPATLTVREILSVVAALRGASLHAVEREIALCGLSRVAGRTAGQLSGGERQRIAMAALFIPDATTYLLDEPTMNLDPAGARLLVERLVAARDNGAAVLFTTHTSAELDGLATGVALLREGQIHGTESVLGTALDRLHEEEYDQTFAPACSVDRAVAAGGLWRRGTWARAGSAGPR